MKSGIYKITSPTNKVYIGQSLNIEKRFKQYQKLNCKGQTKLYNSFLKHKIKNHTFEIIEYTQDLDNKEQLYKQQYIDKIGWENCLFLMVNDGKGGNKSLSTKQKMSLNSVKTHRKIKTYDLKGNYIYTFKSPSEAKNILFKDQNLNTGEILSSCKRDKQLSCRGYIFQFEDDDKIIDVLNKLSNSTKHVKKQVIQLDTNNNPIKIHKNSYQAEKELRNQGIKVNSADIRACCNGKQKTSAGFKWKYSEQEVEEYDIMSKPLIEKQLLILKENTSNFYSKEKRQLYGFLQNLDIEMQIKFEEADFYYPQYNLAIMVIDLKKYINNKPSQLIKIKKKFNNKGIKLIQIFSDEILNKFEIVKSRIKNELKISKNKIYARKCKIRLVENNVKNEFLDQNHIQGKDRSKIKLGLYFEDKLVSIMSFGKARIAIGKNKQNNPNNWELVRFCNLIDHNVVGAASKLLKYFIKEYKPSHIFSFADNRWSNLDNNLYTTIGFEKTNQSNGYFYTKDFKSRLHRYNFNKFHLKRMGYDIRKTEKQIMSEIGYFPIWDCGTSRYEMNLG